MSSIYLFIMNCAFFLSTKGHDLWYQGACVLFRVLMLDVRLNIKVLIRLKGIAI